MWPELHVKGEFKFAFIIKSLSNFTSVLKKFLCEIFIQLAYAFAILKVSLKLCKLRFECKLTIM